jgi:magnesium-transporting ATPase (P-type)
MTTDRVMNEDEKEKPRSTANEKRWWPFILATLFFLPLFIVAVSYIFNAPLVGYLHPPFVDVLTAGPLILVSAVIASVFIFLSWVASPFWCRFILSFYLLVIVIILIMLFPSNGFVMLNHAPQRFASTPGRPQTPSC